MDHLRRARAFQICRGPGGVDAACHARCAEQEDGVRFHWLEQPSAAWEWISQAPSVTESDRLLARELLLEGARRSWPPIEFGTGNRSIVAAAGLLRLAQLFPDAKQAREWKAYAERVWSHFLRWMDTEEDAASYAANVWWPGMLQLIALQGQEQHIWSKPEFVSLVDRTFVATAPLGAMPGFGDGSSWGIAAPGLVWLFYEASARLRDGRYRWIADRMLRFQAARVVDPRSRRDPWERKLHHLAFAWLAARDLPTPQPPRTLERALSRKSAPASDVVHRSRQGGAIGQRFEFTEQTLAGIVVWPADENVDRELRLRIWRWRTDRESTVAGAPLYTGPLTALSDDDGRRALRADLLASGSPGSYYLELHAGRSPVAFLGTSTRDNAETSTLWIDGQERRGAGLALAVFGLQGEGSIVTERRLARRRPRPSWGRPPQAFELTDERVPDKLVLRSGFQPEDLFALVNLVADFRHGDKALGAFSGIFDKGSVLLGDAAYPYFLYRPRPQDENAGLLGSAVSSPAGPRAVTVDAFEDTPNLTVVDLRTEHSERGEHIRRILFVKNRFLLVRDRFVLRRPGDRATVRWHFGWARRAGPTAFDVATQRLLDNVWLVRNPPRFARLDGIGATGSMEAAVERHLLPPAGCPEEDTRRGQVAARCRAGPAFVVSRAVSRGPSGDAPIWLDSLLVPFAAGGEPEVETVTRKEGSLVLRITLDQERWTIVDRPDGARTSVPGLEVDARLAVHARRSNAPDYLFLAHGSRYADGRSSLQLDAPSTVELGGFPPTR